MDGEENIEVKVEIPATAPAAESAAPVVEAVAVIEAAAEVLKVDETKTGVDFLVGLVHELNIKIDGVFDLLRAVQANGEAILATQVAVVATEVQTQEKVEEVTDALERVEIPAETAPAQAPEKEPEKRAARRRGFI